jgi:hypothetical protein
MADVTMPDGRVIRDLTAEEYDATYSDGEPHGIPADVLAEAEADADQVGAQTDA